MGRLANTPSISPSITPSITHSPPPCPLPAPSPTPPLPLHVHTPLALPHSSPTPTPTQARYVACIGESLYIDGGDPTSGPARWINHAPAAQANVYYRKQRFGPAQNMHFYAKRAISAGEELTFDYGDDYWAALEATPVQQ